MKYLSLLLLLTSLNMENNQTISGPIDVSNRRVLDASGTGCGRLSPPDPADDPGGISCSISESCSRTGSLHATAVDVGLSYPCVEVEEDSFDHEEEVYDGSQSVLDPRLASGLKLNNVTYNPSLYRRGNEGQTASQELYNSEKYASLAEAQVDERGGNLSSNFEESDKWRRSGAYTCMDQSSVVNTGEKPASDKWLAQHGAATSVDLGPSDKWRISTWGPEKSSEMSPETLVSLQNRQLVAQRADFCADRVLGGQTVSGDVVCAYGQQYGQTVDVDNRAVVYVVDKSVNQPVRDRVGSVVVQSCVPQSSSPTAGSVRGVESPTSREVAEALLALATQNQQPVQTDSARSTPFAPVSVHVGRIPVCGNIRGDTPPNESTLSPQRVNVVLGESSRVVRDTNSPPQAKTLVETLSEAIERLSVGSSNQSDAEVSNQSSPPRVWSASAQLPDGSVLLAAPGVVRPVAPLTDQLGRGETADKRAMHSSEQSRTESTVNVSSESVPVVKTERRSRRRESRSSSAVSRVPRPDSSDSSSGRSSSSSSDEGRDGNRDNSREDKRPAKPPDGATEHQQTFYQTTPVRSSRSQFVKPDKYDGTTDFHTFLCKFRSCAKFNRWSEEERLAHLWASLQRDAAQLLWDSDNLSFDELVEKLKQRFGSRGMEARYQTELRCRRRRKDESIREVAQDIRRLLALAYPGQQSELCEHLGRDAFLAALDDPELELKVREHDPMDLDASVKLAQRFEVSRDIVNAHSSCGKHRALRQVTSNEYRPSVGSAFSEVHRVSRMSADECLEPQRVVEVESSFRDVGGASASLEPSARAPRVEYTAETADQARADRSDNIGRRRRRSRAVGRESSYRGQQESQPPPHRPVNSQLEDIRSLLDKVLRENEQVKKEVAELRRSRQSQSQQVEQPTTQWFNQRQGGGDRPRQLGPCWNCEGMGHLARTCPYLPWRAGNYQPEQPSQSQSHLNRASSVPDGTRESYGAYLRAEVNGRVSDCLLDTGSEVSLIPASLVRDDQISASTEDVRAANGTVIRILGRATVPIRVGGYRSLVTGIVTRHVPEVMLGLDWCGQNRVQWDIGSSSIRLNRKSYRLIMRPSSGTWCRRVVVEQDITVPPRSQSHVPCRVVCRGLRISPGSTVEHSLSSQYWSTKPTVIQPGVYAARTLTPDDRLEEVPVRIMNVHPEPHTLRADAVVSELEQIEQVNPVVETSESSFTGAEAVPAYVEQLVSGVDHSVPGNQVARLRRFLMQNRKVFSEDERDLGSTSVMQHRIRTQGAQPIRQPLRKFPPAHVQAISEHVDNMLEQRVIEPACSPWDSNVVLVRKKDGTFRCCVDYRQLNSVTVKDAYPLPKVSDSLDAMSGAEFFSVFDMRSSYHQVQVQESDRDKTAFICPRGQFRFRMMPFGLCNAPGTFQRLMDLILSGLNLEICLVYLDDIIIFSQTLEEHFERLETVFHRLVQAGLKLKPEKCVLLQKSVKFLGHVVSKDGVATDPDKTRAVADWPVPTSVSEVRSFLGLCGYYRRFVRDFATIAAPLNALTRKNAKFVWSSDAQRSFEALKVALTSPPVLAMPQDQGEFILDTDAAQASIGAVLSQVQAGEERVVAYASRTLDRREQNYCVLRRELLAIVFFLKHYKQYLLGREFRVRTDHAALTWLRKTPDPIGQQARWLEVLEEFNFTVEHRPGKQHANADALSRRPCPNKRCACREPLSLFGEPADRPAFDQSRVGAVTLVSRAANRTVSESSQSRSGTNEVPTRENEGVCGNMRDEQARDPDIVFVRNLVESGAQKPSWDVTGLPLEDNVRNSNVDEFVTEQQERAEEAYRIAREHLHEGAHRSKRAYDARVKPSEFKVGDYVYYYCPRRFVQRSPKWQQCYTGPFRIVREIPPVNFVLKKSPKSTPFVVHADKIKLCHADSPAYYEDERESQDVESPPTSPVRRPPPPVREASPQTSVRPALAQPAAKTVKPKRRVTFAPTAELYEVSRWIKEASESQEEPQSALANSGRPERVRRPPLSLQDYYTTDDRGRRMIRAASMLAESLCAAVRAGRADTTQVVQACTPPFHADICGTEATRGEVQVPASTVPASTVHGVRAV